MKEKKQSNIFIRMIPIYISLLLLILGIALNIPLFRITEDQLTLFVIGNITPKIMVKVLYMMWTIGACSLPLTVYYVFFNKKKPALIITALLTIIILPICMYLGAADEANVVGIDVVDYEIYTDGTHKLYVKIMNSGGPMNYQSFYVQTEKYKCVWKNSGTIDAPIKWFDDRVSIMVYDEEFYSYPLDEFYDN